MTINLVMTPETSQLLKVAIDERYPELKHLHRSVEITSKNPWAGTIRFHNETSSSSAIFDFAPGRTDGKPDLYISKDWND